MNENSNQNQIISSGSSDLHISDYLDQLARELVGATAYQEELTELKITPSDFIGAESEVSGLMLSTAEIPGTAMASSSSSLHQHYSQSSSYNDYTQLVEGTSSLTISPQQTQWAYVHPETVMSLPECTLTEPQSSHTAAYQPSTLSQLSNNSPNVHLRSVYMPLTESSEAPKSLRKRHPKREPRRRLQTSQFSSMSFQPDDPFWSHNNSPPEQTQQESHPFPFNPDYLENPGISEPYQCPSSSRLPSRVRKSSRKSSVIALSEELTTTNTPSIEHHSGYPYPSDCGFLDTLEKIDDTSFRDANDAGNTDDDDEDDDDDVSAGGTGTAMSYPGASGIPDSSSYSSQDELKYHLMRRQNNLASSRYRRKKSEKICDAKRTLKELESENRRMMAKAEGLERLRGEMGDFVNNFYLKHLKKS